MRRTMRMLFALQLTLMVVQGVSALQAPREFTEVDRLRLERLAAAEARVAELEASR